MKKQKQELDQLPSQYHDHSEQEEVFCVFMCMHAFVPVSISYLHSVLLPGQAGCSMTIMKLWLKRFAEPIKKLKKGCNMGRHPFALWSVSSALGWRWAETLALCTAATSSMNNSLELRLRAGLKHWPQIKSSTCLLWKLKENRLMKLFWSVWQCGTGRQLSLL